MSPGGTRYAVVVGGVLLALTQVLPSRATTAAPAKAASSMGGTDGSLRVGELRWLSADGQPLVPGQCVSRPITAADDAGIPRWQVIPLLAADGLSRVQMSLVDGEWRDPSGTLLIPHILDLAATPLELLLRRAPGWFPGVDANGDGRGDIVWIDEGADYPLPVSRYRVGMLFTADMPRGHVDALLDPIDVAIIGRPREGFGRVAIGDLNGDGSPDAAIATAASSGAWISVVLGPFFPGQVIDLGATAESARWTVPNGMSAFTPLIADFNGDGFDDLAAVLEPATFGGLRKLTVVYGGPTVMSVLDLDVLPAGVGVELVLPLGAFPFLPADFDADGREDLVVSWPLARRGVVAILTDELRTPGRRVLPVEPPTNLGTVEYIGLMTAAPSRCGRGDALLSPTDGKVFEPRQRAFWTPDVMSRPDLVIEGAAAAAARGVSVGDLDADGCRDAVLSLPLSAGIDGATVGSGVVGARAITCVEPTVLDVADQPGMVIEAMPGTDSALAGVEAIGNFGGDSRSELLIRANPLGFAGIYLRAYTTDTMDSTTAAAGCTEMLTLAAGTRSVAGSVEDTINLAAWGRISSPSATFDPVLQLAPIVAPSSAPDPLLEVDGVALADLLPNPATMPRHPAWRDRIARTAGGQVEFSVPPAPGAAGSFFACLGPRNAPPLVEAGARVVLSTAPGDGDCLVDVPLQGHAQDLDCDELGEPRWTLGARVLATGLSAVASIPIGTHSVTLTVSDPFSQASDDLEVEILDGTPPVLSLASDTVCLWPPDHRMVRLNLVSDLQASASDNCDTNPSMRIRSVTSSEADDALGSGRSAPDAVVVSDQIVAVRRERSGMGSGRVYTVTIEAVDAAGNAETRELDIVVPHDQGRDGNACASGRRERPGHIGTRRR